MKIKNMIALLLVFLILFGCQKSQSSKNNQPSSTPFTPIQPGTPFPALEAPIVPQNFSDTKLIGFWEYSSKLIRDIAFSEDSNSLLATSHKGGLVHVWNFKNGDIQTMEFEGKFPYSLTDNNQISPDGRFKASVFLGLTITNQNRPSTRLYYYLDDPTTVSFLPNNEHIVIGLESGQLIFVPISSWESRLLGLEDGHTYHDDHFINYLTIGVEKSPSDIYFSPDGSIMMIIFEDSEIQLWDVSSLSQKVSISFENPISVTQFSPDSSVLAIGFKNGDLQLWDTQNHQQSIALSGQYGIADEIVFSPDGRLLAMLNENDDVFIWGIITSQSNNQNKTTPFVSRFTPFPNQTPVSLPTATQIPTSSIPSYKLKIPLAWPVPSPTDEQILAARNCSIETLSLERYPQRLDFWELESVYPIQTACDWAVLATAYVSHSEHDETIPEEGIRAFFQAFSMNPAIVYSSPIFYSYFNSIELVAPPPSLQQPIKSISIDYSWGGMGEPSYISYHIEIKQANLTQDAMTISVQSQPPELKKLAATRIDPKLIQDFSSALSDFIPVESQLSIVPCDDNHPDWKLDVTFVDDTELLLQTNNSNFLYSGGPWQTNINNQNYAQYSFALNEAVANLFDALELPLGQPWAMFCGRVDVFQSAFPNN